MRLSINLATNPFVELRPLFARLRLTMAALTLTALGLGISLHLLDAHAYIEQAQMDVLQARTRAVQLERQSNEARMREPQNQAVLQRSIFLNDLFARKSFSWTSVMMDLERVLPAGVQVTSIEPAISPDGVNIRLRVSGQRDLAVDLVHNLELSQRFIHPRLANETAQTQERGSLTPVAATVAPGGVEFDIMSGYNPLPESIKDHEREQKEIAQSSGNQTSETQAIGAKQPHPAISPEHKVVVNPKPIAKPATTANAKVTANPKAGTEHSAASRHRTAATAASAASGNAR